jgi:segregation and condensation protein B
MSANEPDSHAEALRLIEALLFASAAPVEEASIAERLPEAADVPALLAELEQHYGARGVNLVRIAGGWTFRTAPDLGQRLRLESTVQRRLSRAAVETLAIVAYHQPVTRAEIEEIRGVQISKGTIDTLLEAGWIMPKGRRETVGRPVTWGTTDNFLRHFGLGEINDLPGMDELKAAGLIGGRPAVSLRESALTPAGAAEEQGADEAPAPELEPLLPEEEALTSQP